MRIKLAGDHSSYHCGSAAVAKVLLQYLEQYGPVVADDDEFDVLVMNGEGTMHHGTLGFHEKMQQLERAQQAGKKTYLFNSLWQSNPTLYDTVLRKLDGVILRGPVSQEHLWQQTGLVASTMLDLSYFAPIEQNAPFTDLAGGIAVTDFYSEGMEYVWLPESQSGTWFPIDMARTTWSSLVRTVGTASAIVAGRHHAIYAACRARIPFVAIRGNSHKLEDLLLAARSPIPICGNRREVASALAWAKGNLGVYQALFDWMDKQSELGDLEAYKTEARTKYTPVRYPPHQLASIASARGDGEAAGVHWQKAAALIKDPLTRIEFQTRAARGFAQAGILWKAFPLFYEARLERPEIFRFATLPYEHAFANTPWARFVNRIVAGDEVEWATLMIRALDPANEDFFSAADRAVLAARRQGGEITAMAARVAIAARLARNSRNVLSWHWWNHSKSNSEDTVIEDQDALSLQLTTHIYRYADPDIVSRLARSVGWQDPFLRAQVALVLWGRDGASSELLQRLIEGYDIVPSTGGIHHALMKIAVACNDVAQIVHLAEQQPALTVRLAEMNATVAGAVSPYIPSQSPGSERMMWVHSSMRKYGEELRDRLADLSRSIAVVGNSPNQMGLAQGNLIDKHDEVIRFNRFRLQGFENDYGRRTSVVVTVETGDALWAIHRALSSEVTIALWGINRRFVVSESSDLYNILKEGRKLCYWPADDLAERWTRQEGMHPSTGIAVCLYLKVARGSLRREDFFGFSFIDQLNDSTSAHYFERVKAHQTHDWAQEAEAFSNFF